jgi:PadR family transcriptional regulator PadR
MCIIFASVATYLGEFEYLILMAIARLGETAYGVTIRETLITRAGRHPSFGAIHSTLRRLGAKGLVRFSLSDPEPVRGGRAKKYVTLTPPGRAALKEAQAAFRRMAVGVTL